MTNCEIIKEVLDEIILSIYIKQHVLIDNIKPIINYKPIVKYDPPSIVDCDERKYFKINLSSIKCGLTHQLGNYKTLIRYCYHNNLKLIKPIFILSGKHNSGKDIASDFSKYYDLSNIKVNDKLFKVYDDVDNLDYTIKSKIYKKGVLSNNYFFKPLPKFRHKTNGNYKGKVNIPYNKKILTIAKIIASKLGDFLCIHVRKGDRINTMQMKKDTSCNNIKKIINKYSPKNVYIMTNKINELKLLNNIDNVFFYNDFKLLNNIKDNYYLYCIEKCIMNLATIRCSTFNVKLIDNQNNYYHCYLTNHPGWQ